MKFGFGTREWVHAGAAGGDIVNSTAEVTIAPALTAPTTGASKDRYYLGTLQIEHDLLSLVTEVIIEDGPGGTVMVRRKLQTPANESGIALIFDPPLKFTNGNAIMAKSTVQVTGGIYINATGYIGS